MSPDAILIAFYVITILNVLVAAGFAIAGLTKPEAVAPGPSTEASRVFASYAAARALPLAFVVIVAVVLHATFALFWFGFLAGLIQLADAWIGYQQHDMRKSIGPIVIAVLQFAALVVARKSGVA